MLTWSPSASPGVVGYNVYYGAIGSGVTNEVSAANVTNLVISGLAVGGDYYFVAAAVNSSGIQSALSSPVNYTVPPPVPLLDITNVTQEMSVTNAAFTVRGIATDSVGVANVFYSLNGAPYAAVTPAGIQWSVPLTLAAGLNTFSAYAVDVNGDDSATETVRIIYSPMAALTVEANGEGVISPNLNGSLLPVGNVYTMTAAPAPGFAFSDWTGSTGGAFALYTNGPTVKFTMAPDLVLEANFADTNRPFISITNITQGMWVGSASYNVIGVATDSVAVANVYYSLNGDSFVSVPPSNVRAGLWYADLTLTAGTNTLAAYAVDSSGNVSTTASVTFDYVVAAKVSVQTSGQGTIRPDYNGLPLQIGTAYTMTAAPANGFTLTNWIGSTNGDFTVYTNGPTVRFTMFSNLVMQANFLDTAAPFISITNVWAGLLASNSDFIAAGIATDNVAVASVQYSLNGSPFSPASISNNAWNANLTLAPGTNTFAVYATDAAGNVSATNVASLAYVETGTLIVNTRGKGSIGPNYNGQELRLGQKYSMRATAAAGFVFTNWTATTTGTYTQCTNGVTVQFTMVTNLELQANFMDTLKPYLRITNVVSGMLWTNPTFTVMGQAT
ncbi:MAG: InlB B-repeat-containing protein, partial [Limisphaerales bacterium]